MDERIERLSRAAAECPGIICLGGGLPAHELFPRADLSDAFMLALGEPRCTALQYGWPEGDAVLREWVASRLRDRGADVFASDVIITNGAQQAIAIAVERLVQRGTRVLVGEETYPAFLELLRAREARRGASPRFSDIAYAMTGVENPRGTSMSAADRAYLLASGLPIIADEAYAELRFDGVVERPLIADARDRTWHVGTVSKTLSPGLRVGWLVPPRAHHDSALRTKRDRDLQAGSLAQEVVRTFVASQDYDARMAKVRSFYQGRAERLVRALRQQLPATRFVEPEGGFSVYLETDLEGDDALLLECATSHGVSFDPGSLFRFDRSSSPIAMRLCFSNTPHSQLGEAVTRLERAFRTFRRASGRSSHPRLNFGWSHPRERSAPSSVAARLGCGATVSLPVAASTPSPTAYALTSTAPPPAPHTSTSEVRKVTRAYERDAETVAMPRLRRVG